MQSPLQAAPFPVLRRQFQESIPRFEQAATVLSYAGEQLIERLDLLAAKPQRVLDLGCRNGYLFPMLAKRFPDACIVGADPAPVRARRRGLRGLRWPPLKRQAACVFCACDPHHLPFSDASFDLVVSNLFLPWCHEQGQVFAEVLRVLKRGGAFFCTSAGPDTLIEYRSAWQQIDNYVHVFGLVDMHDLGDAMLRAGFKAPVMDRDNVIVDYPDIVALQTELQNIGAANIAMGRRAGLMSPRLRHYLVRAVPVAQRFPVTLELVHGHAWKAEHDSASPGSSSEYSVSVETLKGSWRK